MFFTPVPTECLAILENYEFYQETRCFFSHLVRSYMKIDCQHNKIIIESNFMWIELIFLSRAKFVFAYWFDLHIDFERYIILCKLTEQVSWKWHFNFLSVSQFLRNRITANIFGWKAGASESGSLQQAPGSNISLQIRSFIHKFLHFKLL